MNKPYSFSGRERITKSFEYRRIHKEAAWFRNDPFILQKLRNNKGFHRLGISVSSSTIKLSVQRNRIKRLIREFFRLKKMAIKDGPYDIVVKVKKDVPPCVEYSYVENRLTALFKKSALI